MNCQRQFIKVTEATITGGVLVLSTNVTGKTYENGERIVFCICTTIPASTTIVPVEITINGENVALQDAFGNLLQSDQIKSRQPYVAVWGTYGAGHLKLCSCTKRSQATPATITPESEGA